MVDASSSEWVQLLPEVQTFLSWAGQHFIGGQWLPTECGTTLTTFNPSTGEPLAQFAAGDRADVDRAVKVARAAFEGLWRRSLTPAERGKLMWRLADCIEALHL